MLFTITLCAVAIRLFQLGNIPHGFTWDEAAIGYNGYAVVTTRRDEWVDQRLPVSFRSFGDYKAPLAIYVNGIFTTALGLTPWVVRLPFALSGILAIPLLYWVLLELFTWKSLENAKKLALVGAGMLAVSPWHILYSRTGFESGIALTLLLVMVGLFVRAVREVPVGKERLSKTATALLALSGFFGVASMYAYHSAKLAVPLMGVMLAVVWLRVLKKNLVAVVIALGIVVGLLAPMIRDSLFGSGLERAGVSVFSTEASVWKALEISALQLQQHLSVAFLLQGETTTLRHGTGVWGVLLLPTYIAGVVGLGHMVWAWFVRTVLGHKKHLIALLPSSNEQHLTIFFILWILIGLLPASIATEVPHSNRALLALPGFIGLALMGLRQSLVLVSPTYVKKMIFGTAICVHALFATAFLHHYFFIYSAQSAPDFYDGYLDAFGVAVEYEKGLNGKPKVDQIFVTSQYGQPYIYALFVRKTNPIWYQGGSLSEKYTFLDTLTEGDLHRSNVLLVAGPDQIKSAQPTHTIYGSDGSTRFSLYYVAPKQDE